MGFVLDDIAPVERDRIVEDAKGDPSKQHDLAYAARHVLDFPKRWAVDRVRHRYLCFAPVLIRSDTMGVPLYFFFGQRLHEVRIATAFGNTVTLVDLPPPALRTEFEADLAAAFAVFGRAGNGGTDFLGNPDTISPEFREQA